MVSSVAANGSPDWFCNGRMVRRLVEKVTINADGITVEYKSEVMQWHKKLNDFAFGLALPFD